MKIQKEKLELAMARACMNARDLQKEGLSSVTVCRAFRGESVTTKTVGKIARALGVDVTELLEEVKQA